MWYREYRDYEPDKPLIKYRVETGKGIIGCEMHDLNGWGELLHVPVVTKKTGFIRQLFSFLFRSKKIK